MLVIKFSPPVNGPKDPWPSVLSLPGAQGGFVGDPTPLARDNIDVPKYSSHAQYYALKMDCIKITP